MVKWRYEILTDLRRDFDPEIEGITLDSIVESCENVQNFSIPGGSEYTRIRVDMKKGPCEQDLQYLKEQLEGEYEGINVTIKRIEEGKDNSCKARNL